MNFILIEVETLGQAYQESFQGQVMRYLNLDGTFLFNAVPIGLSSWVVDPAPPRLPWMDEITPPSEG